MKKIFCAIFFVGLAVIGVKILAHQGGAGPGISWFLIGFPFVFGVSILSAKTYKFQIRRDQL
ncbi:MAG: hypothetical protein ABIG60_03580 [Patescibacteria group bacterium]